MAHSEESSTTESEIFKSKYRTIKSIGKGSFGEAVLVRSKSDGKRYIAKAIDSSAMNPKEKRDVQNEIKILASVQHPNIVRYLEHFEDGAIMFIVMEYADGGDLSSRIKDQKKKDPVALIEPRLALYWFLQVCMALKYLHDNRVLHRDLKTANIFLTSKNMVKLGDFGISTVLQNTMGCAKTVCGTPYYFSPELCQSKPYNNKSDVWALGVVFYETLTLQRPFNAKSLKELIKKVVQGQYEPIPTSVPPEMRALCASLLQISPLQRPSVNRILESVFVQEALMAFNADMEAQAVKEKEDFDAKKPATKSVSPQQAPLGATPLPTPVKPLSDREQLAMLREIGRHAIKQMATNPQTVIAQEGHVRASDDGHPDVDDDGEVVRQKQAIVQHGRAIHGKGKLGGHEEEFGDGPSSAPSQCDVITMPNGDSVPANNVRCLLEADMGAALVEKAVNYVSDAISANVANAEIQMILLGIVGAKFAHNSNSLAKLAVWEGKSL